VANEFETLYQRVSSLQRDLISQGEIGYIDDLETAALKLRQFIDRVRTASYGYAGIFDAIKINQDELAQVYEYDYALLAMSDEVSSAIDNVETSIGTEGLDASIRHLTSVSQQCVDAFNKRSEVMKGLAPEA
jgi:methyl-accepting chemotaxis protein